MDSIDPKFVRVNIIVDGRRTSVSLDALLAEMLAEAVGGTVALAEWVGSQANRLSGVQHVSDGDSVRRNKAGLSRLVQREALKMMVKPELLPERKKTKGGEGEAECDAIYPDARSRRARAGA